MVEGEDGRQIRKRTVVAFEIERNVGFMYVRLIKLFCFNNENIDKDKG